MSDAGELLKVLAILLVMIVIIAIGLDQELLPVSLFCVMRSAMVGREGKIHLVKVWATML